MAPACTSALFLLITTIVSCNASPLLIPRQTLSCLNFSCPATDMAFYPFAPDLSGPSFDPASGIVYIRCYYPFLSNCQYILSTGALVADNDSGYCSQITGRQSCPGSTCSYACPAYDAANYPLGIGSGAFAPILFCTYPTPQQLNVAVLFCNYFQRDGSLLFGNDNDFCPLTATYVNASTPYCPSHSAVVGPTTVTPLSSPTSSISTTSSSTAPSSSNTAQHDSSHSISGAIAGGIIGSLFILALASYVLYRRHQRHAGPAEFSDEAKREMGNPILESLVHPVVQNHRSPDVYDGTGHRLTAEGTSYIPNNTNQAVYNPSGAEMLYSGLPEPASEFDPNDLNITEVARHPGVRSNPFMQNSMPMVSGPSTFPGSLSTPTLSGNGGTPTTAKASGTIFPPINNDPPPREESPPPLPRAHGSRDDIDLRPQLEALRAEMELLRTQQADVLRALHPPQYSD